MSGVLCSQSTASGSLEVWQIYARVKKNLIDVLMLIHLIVYVIKQERLQVEKDKSI